MLPLLLLLACDPSKPTDTGTEPPDHDGDGFSVLTDCDDGDATVFPGASEDPYDGVDNDCQPGTPDDDLDGDGASIDVDCDDSDDRIGPGAEERCNGLDDDCDGTADDGAYDASLTEVCGNGEDDNCDGTADDCGLEGDFTLDDADASFLGEAAEDYAIFAGPPADLDGDGDGELVVRDPRGIYVFAGPGAGRLDRGEAAATIVDSSAIFTEVGDLNGDAAADLALGVFSGESDASIVDLLLGPVSGELSQTEADVHLLGDPEAEGSASAISMHVGDLDGDGAPDLLTSARYLEDDYLCTTPGLVAVHTGALIAGSSDMADADAVITSDDDIDCYWWSALAGDLNGDGVGDIAIGIGEENMGFIALGPVESMILDDADLRLDGDEDGDGFAARIEGAGDADQDGLDDLWLTTRGDISDARLFAGAAGGVETEPVARVIGLEDRCLCGLAPGDLNGDALPDVLLGYAYSGEPGTVSLTYGPFSGISTVDDADAHFLGLEAGDHNGYYYMYTGDHDGDGVDDVATSAYSLNDSAGGAFIFTSLGM